MNCKLFADERQNALFQAISDAAHADLPEGTNPPYEEKDMMYLYLENTPVASIVCEVIDQLNRLGYQIVNNKGENHE